MDARLWTINGKRLTHLRREDLPSVAQGIVDVERGRATVRTGITRDTPYVILAREKVYEVVVRGDDWVKVVPFLRNTSTPFRVVTPSSLSPSPVPSPQPKRVMQPAPQGPYSSLTSFLQGLEYPDLREIQGDLSTESIPPLIPSGPLPSASLQKDPFYLRVLGLLERLFPETFPTSPL